MFAQYWSHYLLFKRGNLLKKVLGKNKWLFVCTYKNSGLKILQNFAKIMKNSFFMFTNANMNMKILHLNLVETIILMSGYAPYLQYKFP